MKCENSEPLGRQIYLTAQEIKNYAEKLLKPYELTLEQFHLLKHMSRETGMSQRELGELVNKTPANITRILDRLELKELIVRQSSRKDRRTSQVLLTNEGQALIQDVISTFELLSSHLTQGISEHEQQKTKEILNRIEQNIRSLSDNFQS